MVSMYIADATACAHRRGMAHDDSRLMVGTLKTRSYSCVKCISPLVNSIDFWPCLVDNRVAGRNVDCVFDDMTYGLAIVMSDYWVVCCYVHHIPFSC